MCKQSCPFKALKACLAPQVNAKCTQHCGKHKQANNGNMHIRNKFITTLHCLFSAKPILLCNFHSFFCLH